MYCVAFWCVAKQSSFATSTCRKTHLQNPEFHPTSQRKLINMKQLRKQTWDAYFVAFTEEAVTKTQSGSGGVAPPVERRAEQNRRHCAVSVSCDSSPQTLRNALKVTVREKVCVWVRRPRHPPVSRKEPRVKGAARKMGRWASRGVPKQSPPRGQEGSAGL